MINKKATGSDVRLLITSTIDVSPFTPMNHDRRLISDEQLALRLQRIGYRELPAQVGELKGEAHTHHF
jgi:hypothetical protein